MISITVQYAPPAATGGWKAWAFGYHLEVMHGRPNEGAPAGTKPRILRTAQLRLLGVLVAVAVNYSVKALPSG